MNSTIEGFLISLSAGIIVYIATNKKIVRDFIRNLNPLRAYYRDLEESIRGMPFIYGKEANVLDDYVAKIIINEIDPETLEPKDPDGEPLEISSVFAKDKMILFGKPGMGKTTFMRHTVLKQLKREVGGVLPEALVDEFPIFIPLKTVDNSGKSPILHHILSYLSQYFPEDKVVDKLLRLTEKGIFLILDGYDEIGFAESEDSIQRELEVLLSPMLNKFTIRKKEFIDEQDPRFIEIYSNITKCRVWLSTRINFYENNRLSINTERDYTRSVPPNYLFIHASINGLADRHALVRKIFDKYQHELYYPKLNKELFLEDIDSSGDPDLIRLSQRPLFLVIMCYIYVKNIEEEKPSEWVLNFDDLIMRCIKALLKDVDEAKVRYNKYVSDEFIIPYKRRRYDYYKEKLEFLKYFAISLYREGMTVFDEEYFEKQWEYYVKEICKTENKEKLQKALNRTLFNNAKHARQIIQSGVVIKSNTGIRDKVYDFPHRRFRELLAIESCDSDELLNFLLKNLADRKLSELVVLQYEEKKETRFRLIKGLLAFADTDEKYVKGLVKQCLNIKPEDRGEDIDLLVQDFIYTELDNDKRVSYDTEFVEILEKDGMSEKKVSAKLEYHVEKNNTLATKTCMELLDQLNSRSLTFLVTRLLKEMELETCNEAMLLLIQANFFIHKARKKKKATKRKPLEELLFKELEKPNPVLAIGYAMESIHSSTIATKMKEAHPINYLLMIHVFKVLKFSVTKELDEHIKVLVNEYDRFRTSRSSRTLQSIAGKDTGVEYYKILKNLFKTITNMKNEIKQVR